jgi:hypothetical protein
MTISGVSSIYSYVVNLLEHPRHSLRLRIAVLSLLDRESTTLSSVSPQYGHLIRRLQELHREAGDRDRVLRKDPILWGNSIIIQNVGLSREKMVPKRPFGRVKIPVKFIGSGGYRCKRTALLKAKKHYALSHEDQGSEAPLSHS